MNKIILASYLGVLLSSCATDRVAAQPAPDCHAIYAEFTHQRDALKFCRDDYKCTWTYQDILKNQNTQMQLFDCYKEKKLNGMDLSGN